MAKYTVTGGPIEHDLQRYELGSEIDLSDDQAEQLLALGEIAVVVKASRKSKQTEGDEGSQE